MILVPHKLREQIVIMSLKNSALCLKMSVSEMCEIKFAYTLNFNWNTTRPVLCVWYRSIVLCECDASSHRPVVRQQPCRVKWEQLAVH